MQWAWIKHAIFKSSVWRSPNWAIPQVEDNSDLCQALVVIDDPQNPEKGTTSMKIKEENSSSHKTHNCYYSLVVVHDWWPMHANYKQISIKYKWEPSLN